MDTQHLQAFVAVAETGSFSGAGQRLHLTQPAISKRIATLEQQLDSPLFDRVGRSITLTQAGTALLPSAQQILQEVADAQRAITDLRGQVRGPLSLVTSHHIGLHRLPPALRGFIEHYPQVKLDLHFLDSEQAYSRVLQGHFDLGIVTLAPKADPRMAEQEIWRDQLQFVVSPRHPLAGQPRLTLTELSQWPAILPDTRTYTTQLVQQLFNRHQLPLETNMVTNHLDSLKMMVSIGLGWSILPQTLLGDDKVLALRPKEANLSRRLGVIYHARRQLNKAAQVFLDCLKDPLYHSF